MSDHPSPNDEQYRIPGTNIMNWTKYSRENIPKDPPKFAVGDQVVIVSTDEIKEVGQDCDGTPLFGTYNHGHGYSASSLIPMPEGFKYDNDRLFDEPNLEELVFALRALGWTVEPPTSSPPQSAP